MSTKVSVTRLVNDLRSVDSAVRNNAAQQIWKHYFPRLLKLARDNLDSRIRPREDERDVLQNMYKSFCTRQHHGEYDLTCRDDLWNLLVTITLNKVRDVVKWNHRAKRDIARDRPMPKNDRTNSSRWALEQMDSAEPSPADAAALNEALERRLAALEDPELRQIALWCLEGYTHREIAGKLGRVVRTVERKAELIKAKWETFDENAG